MENDDDDNNNAVNNEFSRAGGPLHVCSCRLFCRSDDMVCVNFHSVGTFVFSLPGCKMYFILSREKLFVEKQNFTFVKN